MSRIRTIKPGFWTDGNIVVLSPFARLLYIGMWNFAMCDHGHVADDPMKLKLEVLPADDVDIVALLNELIGRGRVVRVADPEGRSYLLVRRFEDHQKIDPRWKTRCPACSHPDSLKPVETHASLSESERVSSSSQVNPHLTETHSSSPKLTLGREGKGRDRKEKTSSSATPPRLDVEELCTHLRDRVVANGGKATVSEKWRTEARLLIDRDAVDIEVAHRLIDWCQDDSFWHSNILSMPKFREKYQQLLLKARSTSARPSGRGSSGLTPREMEIANAELLKEHPDQSILERAGLSTPTTLRAINGGAS
ncbi:hypothetical protein CH305_18245 [Rhodococcus sp. 15-649-2-2]|nr:hypothetical protein CH305_18245 [Rhodococcus sp. 15-649-2-2]